MNKTAKRESDIILTVDIDGLSAMLSCGHVTARRIGEQADAKIIVGRRVLYSVDRIREYIRQITE